MPYEQQVSLTIKRPNSLFETWLEEWLRQAKEKQSQHKCKVLQRALHSLRKYPLVLYSGRECMILEGFGTKLCQLLDEQLKTYRHSIIDSDHKIETEIDHNKSVHEVLQIVKQKINRKRRENANAAAAIQNKAAKTIQPSSEDILNDTNAALLSLANDIDPAMQDISPSTNCNELLLKRQSFTIILLVDTAETIGKSKRNIDATIQTLKELRVKFDVRRLSIGDFLWIAQDHSGNEAVLPYVVERKRMDDLASSIKDGRFREQKFRLNNSKLANIIYMIESKGNNQHLGLPIQNLMQAVTNLQVHNGFSVKFTDTHEDSMRYLSLLSKKIIAEFKNKNILIEQNKLAKVSDGTISLMNYKDFNVANVKMRNFNIKDMFIRQLLQLKGLSFDKALAITAVYPTPHSLIVAYQCQPDDQRELLLANIQYGVTKRKIGPACSRVLYQFFHTM